MTKSAPAEPMKREQPIDIPTPDRLLIAITIGVSGRSGTGGADQSDLHPLGARRGRNLDAIFDVARLPDDPSLLRKGGRHRLARFVTLLREPGENISVNHVTLLVNVGNGLEVKNFDGRGRAANFGLATTEKWRNEAGAEKTTGTASQSK